MRTSDREDEELVAGIRRGEQAALQALVFKYRSHLCRFAFRYFGCRHDLAQEAVSDVFISLWQRRTTLDITVNIHVYLFKATAKHSINIRRDHMHPEEIAIEDVAPEKLEFTDGDHESRYGELMAEIDALLATMPPERQKVFRMNRFENLRYKEIATALGISVNVVQKHMDIAKRELAAARPRLHRFLWGNTELG